jgi:hypothetical protein
VKTGASEKAKGASNRFIVNQSIVDGRSESETKDIMRWEGGRARGPEKLIEWERTAMEKIEGRMDALGMWARDGSEGIESG